MGHVLQWRVAATLSRDASAARLLLDLTALSVKEPTRDRCVQPPSDQRAMCIFRPRSLVNSRVHDSHLCKLRQPRGRTRSGHLVDVHHLAFLS